MLRVVLTLLVALSFSFSHKLIATTYPVYYPLYYIAKGRQNVDVLIKTQADPHHYELTPKDAQRLIEADLVFTLGVEGWEENILRDLPKGRVVLLKDGISFVKYGKFPDPHIWLSPREYAILIKNVKEALLRYDPQSKAYYQKRYEEYMQKLVKLERAFANTLKNCKYRTIVSTHRAWDYLAKDYNLRTVSLTGVHAEEEPRPSEIMMIIQTVKREGIKYIFAELGQDKKVADFIASQTGAKVLLLNSSLFPRRYSDNYFTIMEENLKVLKEGLQCR
ncbi:MAG: metal ABC transporter substrate-binding protein [Hydrogenobacter sp.]|uniref:metal ABC transporter substrate-binding protein n=1 Tax=Hydrogenobacter thermophilus TaxID=940 RepID=UPI0030FBEEA8